MFCTTQYRGSELVSEVDKCGLLCATTCVYTSATANERGTSTLMHEGLPQLFFCEYVKQ